MNKRDIVKASLAHKQSEKVPYCINFTWEAMTKYGDELYDKYITPELKKGVEDGIINKGEATRLAMGNYMFCTGAPWWNWYDVPESYSTDFEAPDFLPKTKGCGSYEEFERKIKFVKETTGCYVLVMYYGSHFEKANFARGIENFLADIAGEPEYAKRLLDFIISKNMVMIENIMHIPEIDGILLGSDWGSQQSLIMSPDSWKELIAPGEQREYDLIHSANKDVWIHSCGNIEMIMPELVKMGVNALNPIQPECMDIYKLKENFGDKITFWGGISTQQTLPYGTPEDVLAEAKHVIKNMSKNGGFITAPAQEIQDDVPLANIYALIEAAKMFG